MPSLDLPDPPDPLVPGTAVFGDGEPPTPATPWRGTFAHPRASWAARDVAGVPAVVEAADRAARDGAWVVLTLAYEAAPAFDGALLVRASPGAVLAWAAAYDGWQQPIRGERGGAAGVDWRASCDRAAFADRVERLQAHIAAGDTYQVNSTFPLYGTLPVQDAWRWYGAARHRARVPFAAWIARTDDLVLSLSPELFFTRHGDAVTARPMKGTQARGRWAGEDVAARRLLLASEKARAENVMIVDLLRNDLGRLAQPGSVRVETLCQAERYPTVWQLTSTIGATVARDVPLRQVLDALFPCGSVTGAPKVRTMQLIAAHEETPRGLYTGAIALLRPGGDATVSVPIRTATVCRRTGRAVWGVGAGIVADSDADAEYDECLLKARVAQVGDAPFGGDGLFETMRLEAGRVRRRGAHLQRLADSADFLGLPFDVVAAHRVVDACIASHPRGTWRARLLLEPDGRCTCSVEPFTEDAARIWRVGFAITPVSQADWRLFHKTRDRRHYDAARGDRPDLDDVLLWTTADRVTESTIANLVVEIDGMRWTPPVSDGLLPGTFRGALVAAGELRERSLTREDVRRAARVWLVNSLRGWMRATLVD